MYPTIHNILIISLFDVIPYLTGLYSNKWMNRTHVVGPKFETFNFALYNLSGFHQWNRHIRETNETWYRIVISTSSLCFQGEVGVEKWSCSCRKPFYTIISKGNVLPFACLIAELQAELQAKLDRRWLEKSAKYTKMLMFSQFSGGC